MRKLRYIAVATMAAIYGNNVAYGLPNSIADNEQLKQLITTMVDQRTQVLQKRINSLESEVVVLKQKLHRKNTTATLQPDEGPHRGHTTHNTDKEARSTQNSNTANQENLSDPSDERVALYLGGTPIFISPYVGLHSEYDGTDLIVNAPTVNFDTRLLKQERALEESFKKRNISLPDSPVLQLSGKIEGQLISKKFSGERHKGDVDLATAEIDIFSEINNNVLGFLALAYDNSATSPTRFSNSRFALRQGFITLGHLDSSSLYASLGQLFVPFGHYSTYMLSSPLTQSLGRTKARALVLGATQDQGPYASAFAFSGNSTGSGRRDGGLAVGYKQTLDKFSLDLSGSIISNLAESEGMQSSGAPSTIPFDGFGKSSITEALKHSVPAYDLNSSLSYGPFSWITEYMSATRSFDKLDMTFNDHNAKPQAFHTEAVYRFHWGEKPGNIALGYDFTKDALALFLPRHRYSVTLNMSFFRNTIATLEYRHDVSYDLNATATGNGSQPFSPLWKKADMLTAQFGIYF